MLLLACLLALSINSAVASEILDDSEFAGVRRFHDCIGDPQHVDLACASEKVNSLSLAEMQLPIYGNRPILHHLMNLYMLNKNNEIRRSLADIIKQLVHKGLDVNEEFMQDPDVLTKALIVRELGLASEMAEVGGSWLSSSFQLQTLFGIPCNPTPIAKMLLHADTILREKKGSLSAEKLLSSASLHASATPSVRSNDLYLLSERYKEILDSLGGNDAEGEHLTMIRLEDILRSVDDITSRIFKFLVLNHVTFSNDMVSTLTTLVNMLQQRFDKSGRSLLHLLALSGSTGIIHDLSMMFDHAPPQVRRDLAKALSQRDNRGHTPVEACAIRFGKSIHFNAMFNFAVQCGALVAESISGFKPTLEAHVVEGTSKDFSSANAEEDGGSGGWSDLELDDSLTGEKICNIKEVHEVPNDPSVFFRDYVMTGTPVVFRGAAKQHSQYLNLIHNFEKEVFLARHGDDAISIATLPYAGSFGISGIVVNISQVAAVDGRQRPTESNVHMDGDCKQEVGSPHLFPENVPLYAFTTAVKESIKLEAPPPLFINGLARDVELQFYLGPAGTGAPPHFHGHAVNTLAFGRKKWFLYPPSHAFYSTIPALEFARLLNDEENSESAVRDGLLLCTQNAGDIMYVPTLWGHATLNLKQSIGVAHEFSTEPVCME